MSTCVICGERLSGRQSKTCSHECRNIFLSKIHKKGKYERTCKNPKCCKVFEVKKPSIKKEYCSRSCANYHRGDVKDSIYEDRKKDQKECKYCHNLFNRKRYDTDEKWEIRQYCSKVCTMTAVATDTTRMDKIRETNMERYGVPYTTLNPETIEKKKNTFMRNYGVDNPLKSPSILKNIDWDAKNTKIRLKTVQRIKDNYGICFPNYSHKASEIFLLLDSHFLFRSGIDSRFAKYGQGEHEVESLGYFLDYINYKCKIIIEWDDVSHFTKEGKKTKKDCKKKKQIKEYFPDYLLVSIDDKYSEEEALSKLTRIIERRLLTLS